MINLAALLNNPRYTQIVRIFRYSNVISSLAEDFGEVRVQTDYREIRASVQPVTFSDLQELPEGLRLVKAMKFFANTIIHCDDGDQLDSLDPGVAMYDVIVWRNNEYAIRQLKVWADYGYWEAIGVIGGTVN